MNSITTYVDVRRSKPYRTARDFFSTLCWKDETSNFRIPVFSDDELKVHPLKWLKYLLLAKVGASKIQVLNQDILRFDYSHLQEVEIQCRRILHNMDQSPMIVLKVVFFNEAGQLPNYRIHSNDDITVSLAEVKERYQNAHQIWLCTSSINPQGSDLGGRITYSGKTPQSWIEIVWYTSPRMIELLVDDGFRFPFVRARKDMTSMTYQVEKVHIPPQYSQHSEKKYLLDLQYVLQQLYERRDSIEQLGQILYGAGARELSLEFKISDRAFQIIDWDTEIETSLR